MSAKTISRVKMLNNWVFVKSVEDEANGASFVGVGPYKIAIPDTAKEPSQKGEVVNVGKGDSNIKIGDIVMFRRRAGFKQIEFEGEKFLAMKQDQILGIMFGDNAEDVTPLKENVFLEWEQAPDLYDGTDILRPSSYKAMYFTGTVVAVGPDVKNMKPGDRVFFDQFCGVEKLQENEKRYAFVRMGDVYCNGIPKREKVAA